MRSCAESIPYIRFAILSGAPEAVDEFREKSCCTSIGVGVGEGEGEGEEVESSESLARHELLHWP